MNADSSQTPRFFQETSSQRSARVKQTSLPHPDPSYRLLVVGTGMIGREHMRVASLLGRAEIAGIYDIHTSSMESAEADFASYSSRTLRRYESLEAACGDAEIDGILICTPNYTHFEVLQVAIKSGKPLFVEKPMATSLAEAAKIVELSKNYDSFIQLGMQYRYKSQYVDAFNEVKVQQSLGAIKTISMSEYRPPFLDKVQQWNKFNIYSGGTLVEKCCHYFDLINLMAEAAPLSVYASGGRAVNFLDFSYRGKQSDIDDHAFVIINYRNGLRASFTLNMFSQELYEEMIVVGEQGRLIANESSSFAVDTHSKATLLVEVADHNAYQGQDVTYPRIIEQSGHHGATFFEHEALVDQLQGKATDSATPIQGLMAMLVASAAQESIQTGALVEFDEFVEKHELTEILNE